VAIRSGSLVESVFAFFGVSSSCADLPLLYDTIVQLSFNSVREEFFL
jgi:hypothetical protein